MCGLYGWQFKDTPPPEWGVGATLLALAMGERGDHGHGEAFIVGNRLRVNRSVSAISDDFTPSVWMRRRAFIGHTRYRTSGGRAVEDTHPFRAGPITLVHNGMIYNQSEVEKAMGVEVNVDSALLAHAIHQGLDLDMMHGYGVAVWHDKRRFSEISLARVSDDGELSVVAIKRGKRPIGIAWASTDEALYAAVTASGMSYVPFKDPEPGRRYMAVNGQLWRSDDTNLLFGKAGKRGRSGYESRTYTPSSGSTYKGSAASSPQTPPSGTTGSSGGATSVPSSGIITPPARQLTMVDQGGSIKIRKAGSVDYCARCNIHWSAGRGGLRCVICNGTINSISEDSVLLNGAEDGDMLWGDAKGSPGVIASEVAGVIVNEIEGARERGDIETPTSLGAVG